MANQAQVAKLIRENIRLSNDLEKIKTLKKANEQALNLALKENKNQPLRAQTSINGNRAMLELYYAVQERKTTVLNHTEILTTIGVEAFCQLAKIPLAALRREFGTKFVKEHSKITVTKKPVMSIRVVK